MRVNHCGRGGKGKDQRGLMTALFAKEKAAWAKRRGPFTREWKGPLLHVARTRQWEEGQLSAGIPRVRRGFVTYVAAPRERKYAPKTTSTSNCEEGGVTFLAVTRKYRVTSQRAEREDVPVGPPR